ncbi:MAG: hypothetical protein LIQ31_14035 [Planctomycetes bacterium]|nr:hypothetical protein [Planctomycetota bacterium]
MLPRKGYPLVILLFLAAVIGTGRVRLVLDAIVEPFRNVGEEVVYLPRGDAMKIIACGFDTPLADALYIKGQIYFSNNVLRRMSSDGGGPMGDLVAKGRDYTYELFDIVTDLNPRFIRAYQIGAFTLASSQSIQSNLNSIALLEKGAAEYDALEARGERVPVDPRWLFHLMQATTYEVSVSSHLAREGDPAGAARAKQRAEEEFLLAAKSPNAPYFVVIAAVGYQDGVQGGDLLNTRLAMLSVWEELYQEAVRREDEGMMEELEGRIGEDRKFIENILATRALQEALSEAGREFLARYGRPPAMPGDLVGSGIIRELPKTLPLDREDSLDRLVPLPDGSFRSRGLGAMETQQYLDYLLRAVITYQRSHRAGNPPNLEALVTDGLIPELRPLPFAALGQEYVYNPKSGIPTAPLPDQLQFDTSSVPDTADTEPGV